MQSPMRTAVASPSFAMVSLAVATILLKLPTLDTPAYWDEMGWLRQAYGLWEAGLRTAIPGLRPASAFWGHPPGLHLTLATLGKIFGVSVNTAHALTAVFAAVGVCGTFLLARFWYGARTAWLAALLLLLSPVYLAQSGLFLGDIPVTALGVLATYFVVTDRYVPYLACASPNFASCAATARRRAGSGSSDERRKFSRAHLRTPEERSTLVTSAAVEETVLK